MKLIQKNTQYYFMLALGERKSIYILFLLRRLQSNTEVTKPSRILDLDVWAQMAILQDMVTRRLLARMKSTKLFLFISLGEVSGLSGGGWSFSNLGDET